MAQQEKHRLHVVIQRIRTLTDRHVRASTWNLVRASLLRRNLPYLGSNVTTYVDFWERAHTAGSHLWLTGSPPDEVLIRLGAKEWLSEPAAKVLDVGVGEGHMARRLSEQGVCFDCLDISAVALERVRGLCRSVFLHAENLPSNEYSLVMHHLVAQHMDDPALTSQLHHLIRSLRLEGTIALQFAAPAAPRKSSIAKKSPTFEETVTGGFLRTPKELADIVRSSGGVVIAMLPREQWVKSSCQFWVAHIGRGSLENSSNN